MSDSYNVQLPNILHFYLHTEPKAYSWKMPHFANQTFLNNVPYAYHATKHILIVIECQCINGKVDWSLNTIHHSTHFLCDIVGYIHYYIDIACIIGTRGFGKALMMCFPCFMRITWLHLESDEWDYVYPDFYQGAVKGRETEIHLSTYRSC